MKEKKGGSISTTALSNTVPTCHMWLFTVTFNFIKNLVLQIAIFQILNRHM